jgi:hypothetical protein
MTVKKVYNEQVIDTIEITDSVEIVFYYDYFDDKIWANIRKFIKSKEKVAGLDIRQDKLCTDGRGRTRCRNGK